MDHAHLIIGDGDVGPYTLQHVSPGRLLPLPLNCVHIEQYGKEVFGEA